MRRLWSSAIVGFVLLAGASGQERKTRVTSVADDEAAEFQAGQGQAAQAAQGESQGAGAQVGISTIPLKIRIPESTEFVTAEAALDSTIPDCVRKDPASVEENGGITVTAETFTDCAKHELRRIQDEFDTQARPTATTGPRGKSDKAAAAQDGNATPAGVDSEGREIGSDREQDNHKRQDTPHHGLSDHQRVNEGILAQHGIRGSDSAAASKGAADANATAQALPGSGSNDMLAVLQTVFDYKRVMNDMRRILRGDVFGVLGEYPGRMNGLFKMVQELPRRIMKSIGIVNRLRSTTTDTTFRGVLTNLKEYLTQASHTAKDLPAAFTLVSVMDTLRNVAHKIGDGSALRPTDQNPPIQPPAQRALLTRVEELLRNPLGEVFNVGPYGKIAHGAEKGRQLLARRIFDFHPDFPQMYCVHAIRFKDVSFGRMVQSTKRQLQGRNPNLNNFEADSFTSKK